MNHVLDVLLRITVGATLIAGLFCFIFFFPELIAFFTGLDGEDDE